MCTVLTVKVQVHINYNHPVQFGESLCVKWRYVEKIFVIPAIRRRWSYERLKDKWLHLLLATFLI